MMDLVIVEAAGKRRAWENFLRRAGLPGQVIATIGHICRFPETARPVGVGLGSGRIDSGRRPDPDRVRVIRDAVSRLRDGDRILIATDADSDGDVIALDIIDIIAAHHPDKIRAAWRVRPGAMSMSALSSALNGALPVLGSIPDIMAAAVEGRARIVSDRWISAVMSPAYSVPVGRVRSGMIGMVDRITDGAGIQAETGEILMICRSGNGGVTWFARVPVLSGGDRHTAEKLLGIARRFAGRMVPGAVWPILSLSAAVAPRFGNVAPFSTGDLLAHLSRHHGVPVRLGMSALQSAYMAGMVSYPRTESRHLTREAAALVARLGASCGLRGLDADICYRVGARPRNEALHPTFGSGAAEVARLRELVFHDWNKTFPESGSGPLDDFREVVRLVTALVARRSFEASRDIVLERGRWKPTNISGGNLSSEEMDLLEGLDWEREVGQVMAWSRNLTPGIRSWPLEAILVDAIMSAGMGRASTIAAHVHTSIEAGWVRLSDGDAPFRVPVLTRKGEEARRRTPAWMTDPKMCRMITAAIESRNGVFDGAEDDRFDTRIRRRVIGWLERMPADLRQTLVEGLKEENRPGASGGGEVQARVAT